MQVTFDMPDTYAAELAAIGKDPARSALEAVLIEGYRARRIFEGEIKQALGFQTRMQVHALLEEHGIPLNYDVEEWEQDLNTLSRFPTRQ
jgi:predicted HTH domain antitoxin